MEAVVAPAKEERKVESKDEKAEKKSLEPESKTAEGEIEEIVDMSGKCHLSFLSCPFV